MFLSEVPTRYLDRLEILDSGCWIWTGQTSRGGYGMVSVDGKRRTVHRFFAELAGSEMGEHMHHTCHVRACANPEHLVPMTKTAHMALHNSEVEYCYRGHLVAEFEQTVQRADGRITRRCGECQRELRRRYYRRHSQRLIAQRTDARRRARGMACS